MYEYETFGYLDVQKTGSSFISAVLTKFCTEKLIKKKLHTGPQKDYDKTKFYFISIRDPLDLYISLYSFGCESRGNLFRNLYQKNLGVLYDGTWDGLKFWLEFILDPENGHFLDRKYSKKIGGVSEMVGYQSYRVLRLAIPDSSELLGTCSDRADIRTLYDSQNILGCAIRYEQFCEDICALLGDKLRHAIGDLEEAQHYVQNQKPRNPSDRIDKYESSTSIGKRLRRQLEEREWLLHESFGY
jgi:hypothetical protein